MQIVSKRDNLHEMSNPILGEKCEKILQNVDCWNFTQHAIHLKFSSKNIIQNLHRSLGVRRRVILHVYMHKHQWRYPGKATKYSFFETSKEETRIKQWQSTTTQLQYLSKTSSCLTTCWRGFDTIARHNDIVAIPIEKFELFDHLVTCFRYNGKAQRHSCNTYRKIRAVWPPGDVFSIQWQRTRTQLQYLSKNSSCLTIWWRVFHTMAKHNHTVAIPILNFELFDHLVTCFSYNGKAQPYSCNTYPKLRIVWPSGDVFFIQWQSTTTQLQYLSKTSSRLTIWWRVFNTIAKHKVTVAIPIQNIELFDHLVTCFSYNGKAQRHSCNTYSKLWTVWHLVTCFRYNGKAQSHSCNNYPKLRIVWHLVTCFRYNGKAQSHSCDNYPKLRTVWHLVTCFRYNCKAQRHSRNTYPNLRTVWPPGDMF